jgi:methyl halide transferase
MTGAIPEPREIPMSDPPSSQPASTQAIDWEGRYRDGATGWERAGLNPSFVTWRESGALAPCRILVPGAGRSPEPVALAEAGFDVTLVDASPTAVATQRARLERLHVNAQVTQADLLQWDPAAPFDAIYDQACLCALPPAIWPDYAARLKHWTKAGGELFILFMQSTRAGGPPFHCDLGQMRLLFPETQWIWPDTLLPTVPHSPGIEEQPAVLRSR